MTEVCRMEVWQDHTGQLRINPRNPAEGMGLLYVAELAVRDGHVCEGSMTIRGDTRRCAPYECRDGGFLDVSGLYEPKTFKQKVRCGTVTLHRW